MISVFLPKYCKKVDIYFGMVEFFRKYLPTITPQQGRAYIFNIPYNTFGRYKKLSPILLIKRMRNIKIPLVYRI